MGNKSKGNVLIKIISVLVAIILWFYIQTVQNPYIDFTFNALSVSLHNAHLLEERNLVVTGETDFKTDVTVNCARMSLGKLKKDDFEIRINPENRVCSKFNLQSLATFPVAAPGEMGMRVTDDCAEKHMM